VADGHCSRSARLRSWRARPRSTRTVSRSNTHRAVDR
jgi:hypothetical protein